MIDLTYFCANIYKMKIQYFLLIALVCLLSCKHVDKGTSKGTAGTDSTGVFDYSKTELSDEFRDSTFHCFSKADSKDKFTFYVPKGNIKTTKAILMVRDAENNLVFSDTIATEELINGYDLDEIKTGEQMQKAILTRAKSILDANSFIDDISSEPFFKNLSDEEFMDHNVFNECQTDKRPLFILSLEEENITYYGYSKILHKVVAIAGCC